MSEEHWIQARFKDSDVWAECDASGRPKISRGKQRFVYKLGGKPYSTFPDRLAIDPSASPEAKASTGRSTTTGKRGGSGNSDVFGGSAEDLADDDHVHLWTDGACTGNPGPAGSGFVLLDGPRRTEGSLWLGQGTNNIAELSAVLEGLRRLPPMAGRTLVVHTDSQYVIGVVAKNWKAKANPELVADLKAELKPLKHVVWHWVRGHQGVELNERCDELARQAIGRRGDAVREVGA